MNGRRRFAIQLDVEAKPSCPALGANLADVQLARALHKPLVCHVDAPDYGLLEPCASEPGRLRLRRRDDARFDDGTLVTRAELIEATELGLSRQRTLAALLGVELLDAREVAGELTLELGHRCASELAQRLLSSHGFRVTRDDAAGSHGTGPFRLASTAPLRLQSETCELVFPVIEQGADAMAAFRDGALDATNPTCFDVARQTSEGHACEPDVNAFVLIDPRQAPALATAEARAVLSALVTRLAPAGQGVLVPTPLPGVVSSERPSCDERITLAYADYWPNAELAELVATCLRELCASVELLAVPLRDLTRALEDGRAQAALMLRAGSFGIDRSLDLWRLTLALRTCPLELAAPLQEHAQAWIARQHGPLPDELSRVAHAFAPVVPLCRFRSSYLRHESLAGLRALDGNYFDLESLA